MSALTYEQARHLVLETTEIGYTQKSQDRLWTVFIFDEWSEDEMRGSRLWFSMLLGPNKQMAFSYDVWDREMFFTSRKEAEIFAETQRDRLRRIRDEKHPEDEVPEVYVINWGDDRRWEKGILGDNKARERVLIEHGKFTGSHKALLAMNEKWKERWS